VYRILQINANKWKFTSFNVPGS